jgi:hypothetical protein
MNFPKKKYKLEKNIAIIIYKNETRMEDLPLKVKTIFHKIAKGGW